MDIGLRIGPLSFDNIPIDRFLQPILRSTQVPKPVYKDSFVHYTILFSASTRSAIVQHQQLVKFRSPGCYIPVANPFVYRHRRHSSVDVDTIKVNVNNRSAKCRSYVDGRDSYDVAFIIGSEESEFVPGEDYKVFSASKYTEIEPSGECQRLYKGGFRLETTPYSLCFAPRTRIDTLFLDLMFLDTHLIEDPEIDILRSDSLIALSSKSMRPRSIFKNHFFWSERKPKTNREYKITWLLPDADTLYRLDEILADDDSGLDLFRNMIIETFVVRPGAGAEAQEKVRRFLSQAKKRVVVFDAYINDSAVGILDAVKKGVQIIVVTRRDAARGLENTAPKDWVIKTCYDIHDRFLINDDTCVCEVGSSLADLGTKVCTINKHISGSTGARRIIEQVYDSCNISRLNDSTTLQE